MTDHLFIAPRHIVAEQELTAYPPEIQHQFRGDPACWLPGELTMHGGATFHTRIRFLGVRTELRFTVGPSWMRGDVTTRRVRIEFLEPPFGVAWLLPVVEGELTVWGDPRPRIRFEGRSAVSGLLGVRTWSARKLVRVATAAITDRLSAQAPPIPPSRAQSAS